jgi:hypothetical protein
MFQVRVQGAEFLTLRGILLKLGRAIFAHQGRCQEGVHSDNDQDSVQKELKRKVVFGFAFLGHFPEFVKEGCNDLRSERL